MRTNSANRLEAPMDREWNVAQLEIQSPSTHGPHERWRTPMHDNPGRVAGLWYLLIVLLGPLRLIYIPSKLFVKGNAAATVSNIASHQFLFRTGIVSDLIASVALVLLVFAFYGLLRGVDPGLAVQVVIFGGIMPALLSLVGVVYDMAALTIAQGVDLLSAFSKPQLDEL